MAFPFFQPVLGIFIFLGIAWVFSKNKRAISYMSILKIFVVYGLLTYTLTQTMLPYGLFSILEFAFKCLRRSLMAGTHFVFGNLGGESAHVSNASNVPFILAFQVLPMIIFISAFSKLLYHWGVIQFISRILEKAMELLFNLNGVTGLFCSLKLFFAYVEAALLVQNYLQRISDSQFFLILVVGLSTTSISMMGVYEGLLTGVIQHPIHHIITCTLISIPASVLISYILVPETSTPADMEDVCLERSTEFRNGFHALVTGTAEGTKIYVQVVMNLLVMVALVAFMDHILGIFPAVHGMPLTCSRLLGWALAWVVWLFGIPWSECIQAAQFLGVRIIENEIIAYSQMVSSALTPYTKGLMVYPLCSFASFATLGVWMASLLRLALNRDTFILKHISWAFLGAILVSFLNGSVMGVMNALNPLFR